MAQALAFWTLLAVTMAAGRIDAKTEKVPNKLTYPAFLAGCLHWLLVGLLVPSVSFAPTAVGLGLAVLVAAVGFGTIHALGGFGMGDVKLMLVVAAWSASWQVVFAVTVYALLASFLMALWVMVRRKRIKQTLMRILMVAMAPKAMKDELNRPDAIRLPFAVCIAIGTALAGAEHMLGVQWPWSWATL